MFKTAYDVSIFGGDTMVSFVLSLLFFQVICGCCTDSCKDYGVDCQDYLARGHTTSGVYYVTPTRAFHGYNVYCDMITDGGGWLVFQRRLNGTLDFYREWRDYENGFGDPNHEYWLGLRPLKAILSQGYYELRIDLTDFEGCFAYAHYDHFDMGDITENYRLTVTGYIGTAGDSLRRQDGSVFSTMDRDNDSSEVDCAEYAKGAWWYERCHDSNLNGQYLKGNHTNEGDGVNWRTWKGYHYSLKTTDMKIRRAV